MSVIPIEKAEIIKPILRQKRMNTMDLLIRTDNETSLKNSANKIVITGSKIYVVIPLNNPLHPFHASYNSSSFLAITIISSN